jgi:hypothetical protein
MNYIKESRQRINLNKIGKNYKHRISNSVKKLLEDDYVIDVHTHLFDIKCINKSYFIIRFIKDALGIKSNGQENINYSIDKAYKEININEDNWEESLINELEDNSINHFVNSKDDTKGFIDILKATKFLKFKKMEDVYNYYIRKFSLAEVFNLPKDNVLTTALMMDLEIGWNTKIKKSIYDQITELKELSVKKPVLPFLFCDPRRAEIENSLENLYSLFNYAFCSGQSFFGVKIYPALGYDPSDFRLWPIYEICEQFSIPVLSHCGGESISTDNLNLDIFEGDKKKTIIAKNRKEIAYILNDPLRWEIVLKKFPKLKLNLAHFGGYETWESSSDVDITIDPQQRKNTIFRFMEEYDNVYADFSFNLVEINLSDNLKNILFSSEVIREKTLFGSDYWVVNKEGNLQNEQNRFIEKLDEGLPTTLNLGKKLALDNPKKYLFD